ncbi:YraN family protein [Schaalia suimastitidis]|uniref:YraN family protein n=1 Tax=Schaalia suimastitidis TaxID=121163 RepID=UPI000429B0D9|nr:YraN family protein [Schaalia suimastitidis]
MQAQTRRGLGKAGEAFAADLLEESGYQILARNWRAGHNGELDIIAQDDAGTIVICEVKTRVGTLYGTALEAVDPKKLRRLRALAAQWARQYDTSAPIRLDVIALTIPVEYRPQILATSGPIDFDQFKVHVTWVEGVS